MILKDSKLEPWVFTAAKKIWHHKAKRLVGVLLLTFLVVAFGTFALGIYVQRSGFLGNTLIPLMTRYTIYLPKKVHAMFLKPEIEHITIDIKHKNFMKLAYKRNRLWPREFYFHRPKIM